MIETKIIIKIILWATYLVSLYFAVFWFLVLLDGEPRNKRKKLSRLPKVSIAVPAFNEEENIEETISSLIKLDYPRELLEIIVVNDGSTDGTEEKVRKFKSSHKSFNIRILSKENCGKGAALNKALAMASGEFFVCLDADSTVSRNALMKILPNFTGDDVAVVLPNLRVRDPKNILQRMQWTEYIINMFYKRLMSCLNCVHVAPGPFSVYRRKILEEIGGFDEKNLTEDMEITLRLQKMGYQIKQLMDTDVYTYAPSNFNELYRQRNRWFKGSLLNVLKYKSMIFNKKYGDFGLIQMPTVLLSGVLAVILITSFLYFGLKPYFKALYNFFFIDFDFYTLIKTFRYDFNFLDINYPTLMVAIVMLILSLLILKKSHLLVSEKIKKHGIAPVFFFLFFYYLILGLVWIGVLAEVIIDKKQKW